MTYKLGVLAFLLFIYNLSLANEIKWGEPTLEEKSLKECSFDKDASAVVTWESGEMFVDQDAATVIQKHVRIKVLKNSGKDVGNVFIDYFSESAFEHIVGLEAQTINFDAEGNKIITKVTKSEIIKVKVNNYTNEYRIAFPDIKEGSILEYRYSYGILDYFFLEGWFFQGVYPKLKSEFKTNIDPKLIYLFRLQGSLITQKYEQGMSKDYWMLENVPAIIVEPYSYNRLDYVERISFQLYEYLDISSRSYKKTIKDWNIITSAFHEIKFVKSYSHLNAKSKQLKAFLINNNLINLSGNKDEIALKLYQFVNNNFVLKEEGHPTEVTKPLNKLIKDKTGNRAEINLLYAYLCNFYRIKAYPMATSVKTSGKFIPQIPLLKQLNVLFTIIEKEDGSRIYADPTDPKRSFGLLELNYLSGYGVVLKSKKEALIEPIEITVRNAEEFSCIQNFESAIKPEVQMLYKAYGYDALRLRRNIEEIDTWFENNSLYALDSMKLENADSVELPLKATMTFKVDNDFLDKDIIYIEPFISKRLSKNPFERKERLFPVDFGYTFSEVYRSSIIVPKNFTIDQIPANLFIKTPGDEVEFSYKASFNGTNITILARLNILKTEVPVSSYESLRVLMTDAINKLNEPIVLKKKE